MCLRRHLGQSNKHDIGFDRQNGGPKIVTSYPSEYVYECGIVERTVESRVEHALTPGRPNDNRALLHIGWDYCSSQKLSHVSNAGFPEIVDMLGPDPNIGYSGIGYSYLLIFKTRDAIKFRLFDNKPPGEFVVQWDGNQFIVTNPPLSLPIKPTPWKEL